uniref:Putative nucleoporin n=1 Tax=Ornithodoros turicata TaxID=34597 RepID=A0A2R5LK59_9ACAR
MDVLAFLEATCMCAANAVEQRSILRGPMCLPPHAGTSLCSQSQANWWKAAYVLQSKSVKENLGDLRRVLQRGLEVVRGLGNHGLDVRLVVQLARTFAAKSLEHKESGNEAKMQALEGRAALYWQLVISLLEHNSGSPAAPRERLFPFTQGKAPSHEEAQSLCEEGRLFLGIRAMNADCLEEAAAIFSDLSSAHASFYLALVLKKLALQEDTNKRRLLLQRAKDSLFLTLDRTRADSKHPLTQQLRDEIEDVEEQLNISILNYNNLEDGEHYVTVTEYPGQLTSANIDTSVLCSTPRVDSSFFSRQHNHKAPAKEQQQQHLVPSPERLDSQLRSLSQTQETVIHALSQLKDANRLIVDELKQHQQFMEQILKKVEELSLRPQPSSRTRQHREDSEYVDDYGGNYEGDYDHYADCSQLESSMGGTNVPPSPHPAMGYGAYRPPAAQPYGAYPAPTLGYPLPPHHYAAPVPPAPLMGPRAMAPPPPLSHQAFYPPHNVPTGLPLAEGQGLPQFRFDITQPPPAASDGRTSAFSRLGYSPSSATLPQPIAVSSASLSMPQASTPAALKTAKSGAPHAFQIPLPSSSAAQTPPFFSAATSSPSSSEKTRVASSTPQLEGLLKGTANTSASGGNAEFPTPSPLSRRSRNISSGSDDLCDETEVEGNFKPLIPLPEEVTTCTGEEDEKVCFEERARLFRFVDKEWKERGIGVLKLLENKEGKVRLLMRRDQVLKVCANHYILGKMSLTPLLGKDTAWIWDAQDFADGEPHPEKFCVRFKTPEIASRFKDVFNKAVQQSLARVAAATTLAATTFGMSPSAPTSTHRVVSVATPTPIKTVPAASVVAAPTSTAAASAFPTTPKAAPPVSNSHSVAPGLGFVSSGDKSSATTAFTVGGGVQPDKAFPKPGFSTPAAQTFAFGAKSAVEGQAGGSGKNIFGGFTFSTPPKVKEPAPEAVKPTAVVVQSSESTKPSPFASFSFTSPTTQKEAESVDVTPSAFTLGARSEISKLSLSAAKSPTVEKPAASKLATKPRTSASTPPSAKLMTSPGEVPEEFVPNVDFAPVVPLPDLVETKTGEEEEETLFDERAKLFRFDPDSKEWKERGIGQLKILKHPQTGVCRILMRRDQVLKLCANHRILPEMKLGPMSSGSRAWAWSAQDYSDGSLRDEQLAARFKTKEQADSFKAAFEKCQQLTQAEEKAGQGKPKEESSSRGEAAQDSSTGEKQSQVHVPLSQLVQFKPKPGAWNCDACYVTCPADATACIACQTLRPGAKPPEAAPPAASPLSSLEKLAGLGKSFGTGFPVSAQTSAPTKFTFGVPSKPSSESTTPVTKPGTFVFGQAVTSPNTPTFTFGTTTGFGASKAQEEKQTTGPGVEFKFGSPQKYEFSFSGVRPRSPSKTPKSPCTPTDALDASREDEEVESPEADIYFQPVIPLPPKVQTCTGEEGEELLYSHRAKLFRWQGGEWKERGLGDIKVLLKSDVPKKIRLVMRRETVLKVCLNHNLTPEMVFSKKDERIVSWSAVDFSDGEPSPQQFALRLKTAETANEFLNAIENAKKHLGSSAEEKKNNDAVKSAVKDAASSFSFKLDSKEVTPPSGGFFSLSNRFGSPRQPVVRSLFGNTAAPAECTDEGDVKLEYEAKATEAQIALARKFQLPDNFYLYETKPPCPGCRGCDDGTPMKKGQALATSTKTASSGGTDKKPNGLFTTLAAETWNAPAAHDGGDSLFGKSDVTQLSFASLASQGASASSSFLQTSSSPKNNQPLLAGAGTPVFHGTARRRSESGGDDGEVAQGVDIHFEPVVPLPDLVELTTGEEDEESLFCHRGKLYAFHGESKQWKERAVGDIKILKHLHKPGQYRVLMRRDQVHKIACNHNITTFMKLMPLSTSANSVTWNAIDYSDGNASPENFAIRFKNVDVLKSFQDTFEACQKVIAEMPQSEADATTAEKLSNSNHCRETKDDEDHEEEEEEGADEDEEEDEEEIMFEKRVTFSVFNPSTGNYESAGMGNLTVLYDDTCYGMRIRVTADETDEVLCETLIAVQTCLRTDKVDAYWTAIDVSQNPVVRRQFRATFSSVQAVQEFSRAFDEGKECAVSAAIVETNDEPPC